MPDEKCRHGIDQRFCSLCNKAPQAIAPPVAEILEFLTAEEIRATYEAVGEVLGVIARSVSRQLGHRRPEASWVVRSDNHLPTDYQAAELHPALFRRPEVLRTGRDLKDRILLWKKMRGQA